MKGNYINRIELTESTGTFYQECSHKTGWFGYVKTWFGRIRIYVCSDCGQLLQGKELKRFEGRLK